MDEKYSLKPTLILPELFVIALTGVFSYFALNKKNRISYLIIFSENPLGASLNALTFIAMMAFVAIIMLVLVKEGFLRIIKYFIKASLFLVSFFLINWYVELFFGDYLIRVRNIDAILLITSISLATILYMLIYSKNKWVQVLAVVIVSSLTGVFLGISIPIISSIALMMALIIYDCIAVFKGPLKDLVKKVSIEEFSGATFTYEGLTMGMGDLVFYSMLASVAMVNFGLIAFLASSMGILIGVFISFKMLEKRELFPGLPFALGLGLLFMFLTVLMH
ncbi:MAG: hypothetical protein QW589_04620 [Candidatus Bathyarchaeia archaeon]